MSESKNPPASDSETGGDNETDTAAHQAADADQPRLTFPQMIGSAIAAALGVQSSANRKRDFARGKASHFILIGVIGTALFVIAMGLLVRLILSLAGG